MNEIQLTAKWLNKLLDIKNECFTTAMYRLVCKEGFTLNASEGNGVCHLIRYEGNFKIHVVSCYTNIKDKANEYKIELKPITKIVEALS